MKKSRTRTKAAKTKANSARASNGSKLHSQWFALRPDDPMEVLPPETRAYAEKLIANPKLAAAFLQRAGIYTKSGRLTKHYR